LLMLSCKMPPDGQASTCVDNVTPSMLRPFGVVLLAVGIVGGVVIAARRGEFPTRRFVRLTGLIAATAITFASWAGSHQFLARGGECTAVGSGSAATGAAATEGQRDCVRFARTVFGVGIVGAAGSLVALWFVARERIPEPPELDFSVLVP
jgi:hypothetical protein